MFDGKIKIELFEILSYFVRQKIAVMKKVLAIIASPRVLGNSELAAKAVAANVPEKIELKLLRLSDFKIDNCAACYKCLTNGKGCVLKDDLNVVIDAMAEADAFVLSTPVYFLGPNASLKALQDRFLSLYVRSKEIWGKPAVAVCVSGIYRKEGYAALAAKIFLDSILADIKAAATIYGSLPGEIFFDDKYFPLFKKLGEALFGEKISDGSDKPKCPICGSDSFKFLGGKSVRCLNCGNDGEIDFKNGKIRLAIEKDDKQLFLNEKNAMEHFEWLVAEKRRFAKTIPSIRKARELYRGDYKWIKPNDF